MHCVRCVVFKLTSTSPWRLFSFFIVSGRFLLFFFCILVSGRFLVAVFLKLVPAVHIINQLTLWQKWITPRKNLLTDFTSDLKL